MVTGGLAASVAVAVPMFVDPLHVVMVTSGGTVSTGPVVSCTVTVNVLVTVARLLSVTRQVTVVVPNGNVDPDGGVQVGVNTPSSGSLAVTVNVTGAPAVDVA